MLLLFRRGPTLAPFEVKPEDVTPSHLLDRLLLVQGQLVWSSVAFTLRDLPTRAPTLRRVAPGQPEMAGWGGHVPHLCRWMNSDGSGNRPALAAYDPCGIVDSILPAWVLALWWWRHRNRLKGLGTLPHCCCLPSGLGQGTGGSIALSKSEGPRAVIRVCTERPLCIRKFTHTPGMGQGVFLEERHLKLQGLPQLLREATRILNLQGRLPSAPTPFPISKGLFKTQAHHAPPGGPGSRPCALRPRSSGPASSDGATAQARSVHTTP